MLNLSKNSDGTKDMKHTFIPTPTVRNGFRRKKGDNPLVYNLNLKVKKEKKQSSFTNPDPWARIVGSRNTAAINGKATTALCDSGAELQLISKEYCDTNNLEIQPIEKLVDCENMNGGLFGYDGYVQVNVQIPGRDFSEDHLFLVTSEINHQKEIPVVVGTYFIASLSKHFKSLDKEEFDSLDQALQKAYYSWEETAKIREKYGCEPPLGVVRTTKPITIYEGERKEVHGLTKIKHGGYSVNCMSEPTIGNSLPTGLKLQAGYSQLSPGSCRVSTVIDNLSDKDITIPAKAIISQLSLHNKIPKLVYPGDDLDIESEEKDDKDEGLKFQQFQQHKVVSEELNLEPEVGNKFNKVEVEDLGEDLEEDLENLNQPNSNLPNSKSQTECPGDQPNSEEEDDGSWILKLIDPSGLEDWPD